MALTLQQTACYFASLAVSLSSMGPQLPSESIIHVMIHYRIK
ncbi:hypothetical protein RBWH47_01450 [Rhodopirellula baltica WH47]|uniref:Uncharacterized protein n=1 Tax=Rhodopirellula baltica WH47 TaxID=991778 RepID=F2AQU1_RHOBT|nr:hypothetical protein RBWH47_01450 [Rhodopirellula baltica WH47]